MDTIINAAIDSFSITVVIDGYDDDAIMHIADQLSKVLADKNINAVQIKEEEDPLPRLINGDYPDYSVATRKDDYGKIGALIQRYVSSCGVPGVAIVCGGPIWTLLHCRNITDDEILGMLNYLYDQDFYPSTFVLPTFSQYSKVLDTKRMQELFTCWESHAQGHDKYIEIFNDRMLNHQILAFIEKYIYMRLGKHIGRSLATHLTEE